MLRSLSDTPLTGAGSLVTLSPEESRHLLSVRRLREGEVVELLDGRGGRAEAVLDGLEGKRARLRVVAFDVRPRPLPSIVVACACLKGGEFDELVARLTEIGVAAIMPLVTERTEVRLDAARGAQKAARWREIARESLKQCGNRHEPGIHDPVDFRSWLATLPAPSNLPLIASLEAGSVPVRKACAGGAWESVTLLIGPEGDFTPAEYAAARSAGCLPVTLGANVLRAGTAALVLAALVADGTRS